MSFKSLALILLLAPLSLAQATDTLSVFVPSAATAPGTSGIVQVNLSLPPSSTAPAAVEFTLQVPLNSQTDISGVVPTVGAAAVAAGKQLSCAPTTIAGLTTCVLWGLNTTGIGAGTLATFALSVSATDSHTSEAINLLNLSASDPNGIAIATSAVNGSFLVSSPCDLNGDGQITLADVQVVVNQAVGTQACTTGDLNQDGKCDVLDVLREVLVELKLQACHVGP